MDARPTRCCSAAALGAFRRERGFDDLRRAVALVGRGPRRLLGRDLGSLRRRRARRHRARLGARCPARSGSRARSSTTPSTRSAARPTTRSRSWPAARAATTHSGRGASCARRRGRIARRAASGWAWSKRRPRRRLHAEHPGDRGGVPGHGLAGRDLVELLARLRRAQRDRPLRPDRAEGAAGGRRLPLQRPRRSTAATRCAPSATPCPSLGHTVLLRYLDEQATLEDALDWDELTARGRRAGVRARPVRPPAVGALLLRHHRAAEGDRPGPGRDPARAPEDAPPAPRRAGRRPHLLVHHDRLDDVELHRLRAAHRGDRPALRRLARPPGHGRAVGLRRPQPDDHVRHERELHRRLHEGRRRAGRRSRPERAARPSARPARRSRPRASAGSTSTSARTPGCSPPAAAPTCARRSWAACRSCPSTRASCRPARWAPPSSPGTRTASR